MRRMGVGPVGVLGVLALAVLACGGGSAPTEVVATELPPTVIESTQAAPTDLPTEAPTQASTTAPTSTATLEPTAPGEGVTRLAEVDGMVQVLVPAGEFLMGSADEDELADDDEKPQHTVFLDAFWIDQTEVTNAQYALCAEAGECEAPDPTNSATRAEYYGNPEFANYPKVHVSWEEADAYCGWAGRRLPTEAEWEKAARGTDGRLWPWGDDEPTEVLVNFGTGDTTEAGAYPEGASPYGALDMAGNVYEWTADWYGEGYYAAAPAENPTGPDANPDERRSLRGGYYNTSAKYVRTAERDGMGFNRPNWIGFRCAQDE